MKIRAFTLLETLAALTILTFTLIATYQLFSGSIQAVSSSKRLWLAMQYTHNELMRWERAESVPVSVAQGKFQPDHDLFGSSWTRRIQDVAPFPGVIIRKVLLRIEWQEGARQQAYEAQIYVRPK